jgi:predicted dehydrogenase
MSEKKTSRRDFLKTAATSTVAAGAAPAVVFGTDRSAASSYRPARPIAPNDTIQIATIGMGGMGFGDTRTALQVEGVELVAAADCYDGRLARVQEVFGEDVVTTRDYQEVLDRSDVDAVIVATPDHWHAQIAQEAMEAGKDVYLEKPMVQDLEEGPRVIQTQNETGRVCQVGSQFVSSMMYDKARGLYESGAIGTLNMVQANYNRNSALGAWQYSIPPDASPETIDWERFLGKAPEHPFDATRFFRWRNYWDYGTGVPGDLFVHLLSSIHYIVGAIGPTRTVSMGGLRHWTDGRDVPDVMMGLYAYPETDNHPDFTLSLQSNFADGGGSGHRLQFVGDEGAITIDWQGVTLSQAPSQDGPPGYTIGTFAEDVQEAFLDEYRTRYPESEQPQIGETSERVFQAPGGYNMRLDHFKNFFRSIREGTPVVQDAVFGYRAAAPALLTNLSYRDQRPYHWDPKAMKVTS